MPITTLGSALRQINRLFAGGVVSGISDAHLLRRFLSDGDAAAFEALVGRHGPMVLGVCRAIVRDSRDAEDAFQATFLVLVKKGHSIRGRDSLGGWLHQVARRVAIRANAEARRRQDLEREIARMPEQKANPGRVLADELVETLHHEIATLPEKLKMAVVLCDLEGLTQPEAAAQLGCSERTVHQRLAEGRARLKRRLERQGHTQQSVSRLSQVPLTVPVALFDSTVRAAVATANHAAAAGAISSTAYSLTQGVLKTMFIHKLALVTASGLGAGALALSSLSALHLLGDSPPNAERAIPERPAIAPRVPRPVAEPDPLDAVGTLAVRGRVLSPEGTPIAGAQIYVWNRADDNSHIEKGESRFWPVPVTLSDAEGQFQFTLDKSASDFARGEGAAWREARVAAVAPKFGASWIDAGTIAKTGEATLRLVRDDVPIRGRVTNDQGRPVAGAKIKVGQIKVPKNGQVIDAMLRTGEYQNHQLDSFFPLPIWLGREGTLKSGTDGQFEITGLGNDRIVDLKISSAGLQDVSLYAVARPSTTIPKPTARPAMPKDVPKELIPPPPPRLAGSTFEVVAGPSKPIVGVVRQKLDGKPVAGVSVFGAEFGTGTHVVATTDDAGRFRVVGLPKGESYQLRFEPRPGEPYLGAVAEITDTAGLAPIETSVELPAGVPLRVRLIDTVTGARVPAMYILHHKLASNLAEGQAGLVRVISAEKTFLMTVPAGEAVVLAGVRGLDDRFTRARLRDEDRAAGVEDMFMLTQFNGYKIVNIPANAREFSVDLPLTRGPSRIGRVVGPDDKPVSGAGCYGLSGRWGRVQMLDGDTFEVVGLEPGRNRRVVITDQARQLGGSVVIEGKDVNTKEPLTVKLLHTGSITGRLVDSDGLPIAGAKLTALMHDLDGDALPHKSVASLWPSNETLITGSDGRFRIDGIVPGIETDLSIDAPARPNFRLGAGKAAQKLIVPSGQIRALGDLALKEMPIQ